MTRIRVFPSLNTDYLNGSCSGFVPFWSKQSPVPVVIYAYGSARTKHTLIAYMLMPTRKPMFVFYIYIYIITVLSTGRDELYIIIMIYIWVGL